MAAAASKLEEFTNHETAVAWLNAGGGQENVTWSACGPALLVLPEAYESAAGWGRPNITKLLKTLEGLGAAAQEVPP